MPSNSPEAKKTRGRLRQELPSGSNVVVCACDDRGCSIIVLTLSFNEPSGAPARTSL
jgi:hypothetical protein